MYQYACESSQRLVHTLIVGSLRKEYKDSSVSLLQEHLVEGDTISMFDGQSIPHIKGWTLKVKYALSQTQTP